MKKSDVIKISIGGEVSSFVYFVRSRFHKNPQPTDPTDIGYVLSRLAKRILRERKTKKNK